MKIQIFRNSGIAKFRRQQYSKNSKRVLELGNSNISVLQNLEDTNIRKIRKFLFSEDIREIPKLKNSDSLLFRNSKKYQNSKVSWFEINFQKFIRPSKKKNNYLPRLLDSKSNRITRERVSHSQNDRWLFSEWKFRSLALEEHIAANPFDISLVFRRIIAKGVYVRDKFASGRRSCPVSMMAFQQFR